MADPVKLGKGATRHDNILEGDPKFANVRDGDFRLSPASPCIDAGAAIKGITGRHASKAPDIGCHEHGRDAWTAGSSLPREPWDEAGWSDAALGKGD